jgi:hypothetical protein
MLRVEWWSNYPFLDDLQPDFFGTVYRIPISVHLHARRGETSGGSFSAGAYFSESAIVETRRQSSKTARQNPSDSSDMMLLVSCSLSSHNYFLVSWNYFIVMTISAILRDRRVVLIRYYGR